MQTDNYVQMMIDSLQMKENILKNLVTLNEEQQEIVSKEAFDEEKYQENMDAKAKMISNLERLDEGFHSIYFRIKKEFQTDKAKYASDIKTMQDLIKSLTELSVKVQVQEARNKTLIQNRFNKMKRDIQNAKKTTKTANNYYKSMNRIDSEPHLFNQTK